MRPLNIAAIGDLHIGRAARALDLCPYEDNGNAPDRDYLGAFDQLLSQYRISADYLLIAGDITDRGQPDEVKLASDVVSRIAKALTVPEERVFLVPGNHDADWEVLKLPGQYRLQAETTL